jgi:LruC domain-containing protein
MKRILGIILIVSIILSCQKWEDRDPALNPATTVDELQVSSDFDWRTSLNVAFYIKNAEVGIITITSEDDKYLFHKGYYNGQTESYQIIVNIPNYLSTVKINGEVVNVDGNIIIHELGSAAPKLKSLKASSSLFFDGDNDYVDVDRTIIKNYPFTISAWVKTNGFKNDNEDMVIISWANPKSSNTYFGLFIGEDENGKACLRARKRSAKTIHGSTRITDGKWHQIVGVYANRSNRRLYVDGKLEARDKRRIDYSKKVDLLTLGRWGDKTPKSYFKGKIDEIQIWDKALSANEVTTYFENRPNGNEKNLIAYYPLNEGTGTKIKDKITGNIEGEFNGGLNWSVESVGNEINNDDDIDGDGIENADDDFPEDANKAFLNKFPAAGYGTLAFEDLWPARGDYDFNDLIIDYQFRTITNKDNFVSEIQADFAVRAIGASFKNGFGFQFPNNNVSPGDIEVSGYNVNGSYITLSSNGLESQQNRPTVIVFENAFDILPRVGGEMGVNTDPDASVTEPDTVKIVIKIVTNKYTINQVNIANFNPFIMVNQVRGKEIHLADFPPTSLVDQTYFNSMHDNSDASTGRYYKTNDNLPWAINIYQSLDYPSEKSGIIKAYLKFPIWAETNGEQFSDWYLDKEGYRNADYIYSVNN